MPKSTRQSFSDKKCAVASILWANFGFNSKPTGGVKFFHYGEQEDGGNSPKIQKMTESGTSSESFPNKCLFFIPHSLSPPAYYH